MALCKIYKQALCVLLILAVLMGVIAPAKANEKAAENADCKTMLKPLFKLDEMTLEYGGLTDEGVKTLKEVRDGLRAADRILGAELKNMGTAIHAGMVARMTKYNMFLYGPPGGAKSLLVNWLMELEDTKAFKLQLHQMITEQAFTGGQSMQAFQEGKFLLNTDGSLADHVVALIDETDKGNPAALAALLSLLNERKILAGGQVIDARTETVFATSNATLSEIFQQFFESGQGTTAPALLNRFQIKAMVYNWLSIEDRLEIAARAAKKKRLEALAAGNSELAERIAKEAVFLKPGKIDWEKARLLAQVMIEESPHFDTFFQEVVDDLRTLTFAAIRTSEEKHATNPREEPFVYFPSADFTTRFVGQVPDAIRMSLFLDIMLSDLADDEHLPKITNQAIPMDPLSLWRASLMLTTVGPGQARLKFNDEDGKALDIDFNWQIDVGKTRDSREQRMVENLQDEQKRFTQVLFNRIEKFQEAIEMASRHPVDDFSFDDLGEKMSIEHLIRRDGN